jgi:hypothetical protein
MGARKIVGLAGTSHKDRQGTGRQLSWGLMRISSPTTNYKEPDMSNSNFKNWLRLIWLENCREHEDHHELPYTLKEYWSRYRWWLRREYRFQQKNK